MDVEIGLDGRVLSGLALAALERHPLSALWGDMPEDDYEALVQGVRERGVQVPITLAADGKVLDGWHRVRAGRDTGRGVPVYGSAPEDPVSFVIDMNAHRRHLTVGQRTAIVLLAREWRVRGRQPDYEAQYSDARTAEELATEANASVSMVRQTKRWIREGHGDALARGDTTVGQLTRDQKRAEKEADDVRTRRSGARPALTRMERLQERFAEWKARADMLTEENEQLREQLAALGGGAYEEALAENDRLRQVNDKLREQVNELREKVRFVEGVRTPGAPF